MLQYIYPRLDVNVSTGTDLKIESKSFLKYRSLPFIKCAATFLNRVPLKPERKKVKASSFAWMVLMSSQYGSSRQFLIVKQRYEVFPLLFNPTATINAVAHHTTCILVSGDNMDYILTHNGASRRPSMKNFEFAN